MRQAVPSLADTPVLFLGSFYSVAAMDGQTAIHLQVHYTTVMYSTVQYSTALYSTVQYSAVSSLADTPMLFLGSFYRSRPCDGQTAIHLQVH